MAEQSALKRLESFVNGHKSRWTDIHIDDGYGATCWMITLHTEKGTIRVAEVSFIDGGKLLPDCYVVKITDDDGGWPGLEAVINLAVDKATEKCASAKP